jgi:glycosyltransferase involved in cell wall biosynthesis
VTARPRVLIVGPTPPPFIGPAVNTRALLDHPALHRRFDVRHLDTSDRRELTTIGRFDPTNVWLAGRHGAEHLARLAWQRPDLVYLPISSSLLGSVRDLVLMVPAVLSGAALVMHHRGGPMRELYRTAPAAVRAALRFVFDRCARVIVLGERFRDDFAGLVAADRIAVVPNGVDPAPYLAWRPPPGEPPPRIRVVYLSNLAETKGYRLALEAARRLARELPALELVLAGHYATPADQAWTEAFLRDHDLARTVRLVGVVSGAAKLDLLCGADVFVFPTAYPYEAHPTVILEAMAAGLPIVSTRHAAIPETVTDGAEGFLVAAGDVDALADRLRALATDPALRARMGARARDTLLARFTLDRCVERIADVFTDALRATLDRGPR